MFNRNVNHKNFESDTVHGHNTFMNEKTMHSVENLNQNENANKVCDEYEKREMQKEKENIVRKVEYRDYLLKQMHDKEKKNNQREILPMTAVYQETLNENQVFSLKQQRQKEAKKDLDDCIKMKHDLKMKTQRTEFEEERKRSEFWKKHDDETSDFLEKAKQNTERKELKKNEVALLWMEEKRKDEFINTRIEKDSVTDLDKHQDELLEIQKSIRMKKEFYKENEEKIEEWIKNLELVRHEQEKLKKDIEQEEELEHKLKLNSNAMQKKNALIFDEVDRPKKVLQEQNYQCANNRFFGIE